MFTFNELGEEPEELEISQDEFLQEVLQIGVKEASSEEIRITESAEEPEESGTRSQREKTRSGLSSLLVMTLVFTIFLSLIFALFFQYDDEDKRSYAKDIVSILISTQTGITGLALGFYFGGKDEDEVNE